MTSPEPAPSSADAAGLPADPVRYRRRGLGVGFWLLMVFGLLCIAAGIFVARYLPAMTAEPKAVAEAPIVMPWRTSTAEPQAVAVSMPMAEAATLPPTPSADVASLATRLAELESGQSRTLQAAGAALAASALFQAAQTSRPFTAELAAVEPLMAGSGDLTQLRRIAETGAPTRTSLAAEFPAAASRAIAASRRPDSRSGIVDRARHALSGVITIRRIDYTEGDGPNAVLARAEAKVGEGDIEGALIELDALPAGGRDALGPWRARAERRAEVDRRLIAVREASLRTLREAGGAPS